MTNKFVAMTYGFLFRLMGSALGSLLLFIFCLFVLVQIDLFSFVLGEFNARLKQQGNSKCNSTTTRLRRQPRFCGTKTGIPA